MIKDNLRSLNPIIFLVTFNTFSNLKKVIFKVNKKDCRDQTSKIIFKYIF